MEVSQSSEDRRRIASFMKDLADQKAEADPARAFGFKKEAERLERCGCESLTFECEADRLQFSVRTSCRSRVCERCGRSVWKALQAAITETIAIAFARRRSGWYTSMITLTVNKARFGGRMPDRADVLRIYRESSEFFRLHCGRYVGKFTKSGKVREDRKRWLGGAWLAAVEVGRDNNNLHIHAICSMPFTPFSKLRRDWLRITGDSHVVNLKPVKDPRAAARYVLKYITKPPESESYAGAADYAWMIKGSRRIRSGGLFYNWLKRPEKLKLKCRCPFCDERLKMLGYRLTAELSAKVMALYDLLRRRHENGSRLTLPAFSPLFQSLA